VTLQDYVRVLVRYWWLVVGAVILGLIGGAIFTAVSPTVYVSSAAVYVSVEKSGSAVDLQSGNVFATQRAATYAVLATQHVVFAHAVGLLGGAVSVTQLQQSVTASAEANTSVIEIYASGPDAQGTADRANAVAQSLIVEALRLDKPAANTLISINIVQPATPSAKPISPLSRTDLFVGGLAGLLIGIAAIVIGFAIDTRIRTAADLPDPRPRTITVAPAIARRASKRQRSVAAHDESFHVLRTNLLHRSEKKAIAIIPATADSVSREIADALGSAFAQIGLRTLVVDANVESSSSSQPGLAEVLLGTTDFARAVVAGTEMEPSVLDAGAVTDASSQLIESFMLHDVLDEAGQQFDVVIVACPPISERSTGLSVAAAIGASLLVVASGRTRREDYRVAVGQLSEAGVGEVHVLLDGVHAADRAPTGSFQPVVNRADA
jgi:succinoglycan biosynthesis transport protein ExoP